MGRVLWLGCLACVRCVGRRRRAASTNPVGYDIRRSDSTSVALGRTRFVFCFVPAACCRHAPRSISIEPGSDLARRYACLTTTRPVQSETATRSEAAGPCGRGAGLFLLRFSAAVLSAARRRGAGATRARHSSVRRIDQSIGRRAHPKQERRARGVVGTGWAGGHRNCAGPSA